MTCRYFGLSRSTFYRWKTKYDKYGESGLGNNFRWHFTGIVPGGKTRQKTRGIQVKPNKAGGTDFVLPELAERALIQGFDVYQSLPVGMQRALDAPGSG